MSATFIDARSTSSSDPGTVLSERVLATIAGGWARSAADQLPALERGARTYERVLCCYGYDVWVIHWAPGSGIDPHDHAESAGALHVVLGELVEGHYETGAPTAFRRLEAARTRTFPVGHVHEVRNVSADVATSVHVYSPPLTKMTFYQ